MSEQKGCTPSCYEMPECGVCHRRKKPQGRSAPLAMADSLCDQDCPGYYDQPRAGHNWPNEKTRAQQPPKGQTR